MRVSSPPLDAMETTKKILLVIWCLCSLVWIGAMGHQFRVMKAIDTYSSHYATINNINDGVATSYEKRAYMQSGPDLNKAGKSFALFVLVGLAVPFAVLKIAGNLMDKASKPKTAAKKR